MNCLSKYYSNNGLSSHLKINKLSLNRLLIIGNLYYCTVFGQVLDKLDFTDRDTGRNDRCRGELCNKYIHDGSDE